MEVRAGQKTATIAQAMAHNTSTIERDLDMLRKLLEARKEHELLAMVESAQNHLKHAYADFLEVFGETIANEVQDHEGHNPDDHGHERSFVEQAHHDAQLARRYETR